ncbi:MAG TPA: hypothetical protein VMT87_07045 [Vicinamibacteria bacterium]|nr:hypothetical protein [Vicinamibacteria bacterium]
MAVDERPFEDVRPCAGGFTIPGLKWRELLFVGALRPDGALFVRDLSRPLPPFAVPDPFPPGIRFRAHPEGSRVRIERWAGPGL